MADYICTPDEFGLINKFKSIPFKPETTVVEINGAFVNRGNFGCLLRPPAFIFGDVRNDQISKLYFSDILILN